MRCLTSAALNPVACLCLQFKRFREFCIVLVGATANRLEISVAVCVGSIYVSKLLTLDLSLGFHTSDNVIRPARVFEVGRLRSPRLSCLFPCPTLVDTLRLLHNKDIVFGDLRDPNILYVDSDDSVVLIDFDWAGTDGVSRYPATLNPANAWAEDVFPYGIMRKAHDIWQLKRLADLCNPDV